MRCLLILLFISCALAQSSNENVDVVVLGAGIGGINSARTLTDNGRTNVLVLEADSRYGGRINTVFKAGYTVPVELGASFLADSNYNPMINLANQAQLPILPMFFNLTKAWKDGRPLNANQGLRILNNYEGVLNDTIPYEQTGRSVAEAQRLSGYDSDDRGVETLLMTNEQVYGDNLEFIDSAAIDTVPGDPGDQYYLPGGYMQLVDYIIDNPVSIRNKIRLGCMVTKVDYSSPNGKSVVTYWQNGIVKQVTANKVIVAVSMGVLKANTIEFVPALPALKQNAINSVNFGSCGKTHLFFGPQAIPILAQYPVNIFYRVGKNPNPRYNDALTYFYNNQYIQNQPAVQSFYCGNFNRNLELLTDAQIVSQHMIALKEFIPNLPQPVGYIITRWTLNPLFRGVYTDYAVGNVLSDFSQFADSVQGKIYFASEYVGSLDSNGDLRASLGNVYTSYIAAQVAAMKIFNNQP